MASGKKQPQSRTSKRIKVRRRLLVERLTNRRVLAAAIGGTVFEDLDQSFRQEPGETSLADRLVYIDANSSGTIDTGELISVTDESGSFVFEDMIEGTYQLRLYNGTDSQVQITPVEPTFEHVDVALSDGAAFSNASDLTVLTSDSIKIANLGDGSSVSVPVGDSLTAMQILPNGSLLVIGGADSSGDTAWVVDPSTQTSTAIDMSGDDPQSLWSGLAIDGDGLGVVLQQSDNITGFVSVFAIDASDADVAINVGNSGSLVPVDSQVLSSHSGPRSIIAWPNATGMEMTLWSNTTRSWIDYLPIAVPNASELLAYDDASGLLAVRTDDGGVSVHDVDAGFAPLVSLPDVTGPIAIDGSRDLLITTTGSTIDLIDVRDGFKIDSLPVDLSSIGGVVGLEIEQGPNAVVILGDAGITKVTLSRPGAHIVTVDGDVDPESVDFGLNIFGDNSAPAYSVVPEFATDEDQSLVAFAPGALAVSSDADDDDYIVFVDTLTSNGTVVVGLDGMLNYQPNENFHGSDSVSVILHDGRDGSPVTALPITVNSIADDPTGIDVDLIPIGENAGPGVGVGPIAVIDGDLGGGHVIVISDPRFRVIDDRIIFVGDAGDLNFELEPTIPMHVIVQDQETGAEFGEEIVLTVLDENDPITAVNPDAVAVQENLVGPIWLSRIEIHDEDNISPEYSVTVDDSRFMIDNNQELYLVSGVSLDHEAAPSFSINVTVTELVPGGGSFTQEIIVTVDDVAEQAQSISLSGDSVVELTPGDVVGDVVIDGNMVGDNYTVSVDDPRFEVDGSTLKLLGDQWVERATQGEIELTIEVQDVGSVFPVVSATFVIEVVENLTPYHNDSSPYDVDSNGLVEPLDVLLIINYINVFGIGPVGEGDPSIGYDVNNDGFVTALDVLLIINEINRNGGNTGTVGGEGSQGEGEETQAEGEQLADSKTGNQLSAPVTQPEGEENTDSSPQNPNTNQYAQQQADRYYQEQNSQNAESSDQDYSNQYNQSYADQYAQERADHSAQEYSAQEYGTQEYSDHYAGESSRQYADDYADQYANQDSSPNASGQYSSDQYSSNQYYAGQSSTDNAYAGNQSSDNAHRSDYYRQESNLTTGSHEQATTEEMERVVAPHARSLRLSDEQMSDPYELQLNYEVVRSIESSASRLDEFAQSVDASLGSVLDDLA